MSYRRARISDGRAIKVFFDPQIFLLQQNGGISKYFIELIKTFQASPELGVLPTYWKFPMRFNRHAAEHLGLDYLEAPKVIRFCLYVIYAFLPSRAADLIHQTFYGALYLGKSRKWITTLYDMIPESHGFAGKRNPHMSKLRVLKRASIVISISQTSANWMKKLLPELTAKVHVVPLAGREVSAAPVSSRRCTKRLLVVGQRDGYKMGELALRALALCGGGHELVLAGPELSDQEMALARRLGVADSIVNVRPSDVELDELYRTSCALVFPSEIEGFGLPVIEAMALGTPVIAADNEVNREISGDVIFYFESGSASAICTQMRLVCTNPSELAARIASGIQKAQEYSWYRTASGTKAAYLELLAG